MDSETAVHQTPIHTIGLPRTLVEQLHCVAETLKQCDVSQLDNEALHHTTAAARTAQRSADALITRLAQRADQLAATCNGASANEALARGGQVSAAKAREETARSRTAAKLPSLGKALDDGDTSGEHIDAVARALKGLDEDQQATFLDNDQELARDAARLPVDTFGTKVRRLARQAKADNGLQTLRTQRAASELKLWKGKDGMGHFRGSLDPERFAAFASAIEREAAGLAASDTQPERRKGPNLNATALAQLVSHGNGRAGRPHITLILDEQTAADGPHDRTVCETDDGTALPAETASRFACDAVIRSVRLDCHGVPLNVGRRYRTATEAQWVALKAIYRTCAWPDCDRPVSWCQAHHIREWEAGGATDLDNLLPLCNDHHHAVHEGRWSIKLLPDRTLRVIQPSGESWEDSQPDRCRGRDRPQRPNRPPAESPPPKSPPRNPRPPTPGGMA